MNTNNHGKNFIQDSRTYNQRQSFSHSFQSIPTALINRSLIPNLNRHGALFRNFSSPNTRSIQHFQSQQQYHQFHHLSFRDLLSVHKYSSRRMNLLPEPQIQSPHIGPVASLDIDNASDSRFLLCGGADCTISLFDLFPFCDDQEKKQARGPISQSKRDISVRHSSVSSDPLHLPTGHGFSVSSVQWYPVDNGMFVSSDVSGRIIVWDTNLFEAAFSFQIPKPNFNSASPASSSLLGISSMAIPKSPTSSHFLAAVGSHEDSSIRLCDVTSGTYSHQLMGHGSFGVSTVSWSPKDEYLLVSGGHDESIRVWDIRKSGSAACLMVLDREMTTSLEGENLEIVEDQKRKKVGPNNFSRVKGHVQSHGGAVLAAVFSPDGQYLVSAGRDSRLRLWDFRYATPRMLPTYFLGSSGLNGNNHNPKKPFGDKVSLTITQPGSQTRTTTLWCAGNSNGEILGYDLLGGGGKPKKVLQGHLSAACALSEQKHMMRLFTGSLDGMIMGWGCDSPTVNTSKDDGRYDVEDHDTWENLL